MSKYPECGKALVSKLIKPRFIFNATPWSPRIWKLWKEKVAVKFRPGENCHDAAYFGPRPRVDEWNRESPYEGFTYTVLPIRDVAFVQWIPEKS